MKYVGSIQSILNTHTKIPNQGTAVTSNKNKTKNHPPPRPIDLTKNNFPPCRPQAFPLPPRIILGSVGLSFRRPLLHGSIFFIHRHVYFPSSSAASRRAQITPQALFVPRSVRLQAICPQKRLKRSKHSLHWDFDTHSGGAGATGGAGVGGRG